MPKAVAPLEEQGPMETRKVWASVVDALNKKDYSTASKEKQRIEQEQRDKAEERKKKGEVYVRRGRLGLPSFATKLTFMNDLSSTVQLPTTLLRARARQRRRLGRPPRSLRRRQSRPRAQLRGRLLDLAVDRIELP